MRLQAQERAANMDIFDIIGPVMIGPSSSHTAGAVRIGRVAVDILGQRAVRAEIGLSGSFAQTFRGHGTDRALVAGILGFGPDDARIRDSLRLAGPLGLEYVFYEENLQNAHPNTAVLRLWGEGGAQCEVQGASVGGGNILISRINDMETCVTGQQETLIVLHRDEPGMIAAVTGRVADSGLNIGNFRLSRPKKGAQAVMTLETDAPVPAPLLGELRGLSGILRVVPIPANKSV